MSYSPEKQIWKTGPFTRTNFYRNSGTGRDTYIISDNGGTTNALRETNVHPVSGRFMRLSKYSVRPVIPAASNKAVHYYNNGTGRDNYIAKDSGGMMGEWSLKTATREFFLRSLRNTETTFDQVQKSSTYNPFLARKQRSLTMRLAQPKREQPKYEDVVKVLSGADMATRSQIVAANLIASAQLPRDDRRARSQSLAVNSQHADQQKQQQQQLSQSRQRLPDNNNSALAFGGLANSQLRRTRNMSVDQARLSRSGRSYSLSNVPRDENSKPFNNVA